MCHRYPKHEKQSWPVMNGFQIFVWIFSPTIWCTRFCSHRLWLFVVGIATTMLFHSFDNLYGPLSTYNSEKGHRILFYIYGRLKIHSGGEGWVDGRRGAKFCLTAHRFNPLTVSVYAFICVYVRVYACVCVRVYVHIYVYVCFCVYICMFVCM